MRPMKIASLIPATALALALTLVSTDALAWGAQGHRLVARVAETRLTPAAQAEVDRLLASEPDPTLHAIAPWADELRAKDPAWASARRAGITSTSAKTTATTKHRSTARAATALSTR